MGWEPGLTDEQATATAITPDLCPPDAQSEQGQP